MFYINFSKQSSVLGLQFKQSVKAPGPLVTNQPAGWRYSQMDDHRRVHSSLIAWVGLYDYMVIKFN